MHTSTGLLDLLRFAEVLVVAVAAVSVGRFVAGRTRQPLVIGELVAGMSIGPIAFWLLGAHRFHVELNDTVLAAVKLFAEAGLVLFLVGLSYQMRHRSHRPSTRAVTWVTLGALLPALLVGTLFALWIVHSGSPQARGTASTTAFVLLVAVTLSITAVPVLARVLADRRMTDTPVGRTALNSSIVIDSVAWLLLTLAVGIRTGRPEAILRSGGVLLTAALVSFLVRRLLGTPGCERLAARAPAAAVIAIGAFAIAMAVTVEHSGMTAILGAVLAGFAIPASEPWADAVGKVLTAGERLIPIYFVVSGITVLTKGFATASASLICLTILAGLAGKIAGGYTGARLGGLEPVDSLRVGVLMNTRGLTELLVLHVGYNAGVLTAPLYLALVVMALVTTLLAGPLLQVIDGYESRAHTCVRARGPETGGTHPMTRPTLPTADTVAPDAFRSLMAAFPTGVAVITAFGADGVPWGMTCSSLCSLNVSPATLLVCLRAESPTLQALLERRQFTLNLLHADARQAAELFASGDPARFEKVAWTEGRCGPHLAQDAHVSADCRVDRTADGGSHVVVFGEVAAIRRADGQVPLLYGRRRYHTWPR